MKYLGLVAAAIALITGSCSSNSNSGGVNNPSPLPAGTADINILGNLGKQSFSPNPASVAQGNMVAWTNTDSLTHRIAANDGSFDTGNIEPGTHSAALALTENGVNYHCTIHPTMVGSINASNGMPPPCNGPYCY
jgi:plastocyanin